jgi:nitroreductase
VAACPVDAITHEDYLPGECPELDRDVLPTLDGLVMAFRERRSSRVFEDRAVPREIVRALVDIARWAPSASNGQPVDWLAFDDPGRIAELSAGAIDALARFAARLRRSGEALDRAEGYERMARRHAQGEDPIFFRAPVVLVAHVPAEDRFGRDDAIYATYNLMLAAQRLGLGTCQIGYFQGVLERSEEMQRSAAIPEGRRAEVTLVLGYPRDRFYRVVPRRQPRLVWNPSAAR